MQIDAAVARAANQVPQAACLVQALTAGWLCKREGWMVTVVLGLPEAPRGDQFGAHAWVEYQGRALRQDASPLRLGAV